METIINYLRKSARIGTLSFLMQAGYGGMNNDAYAQPIGAASGAVGGLGTSVGMGGGAKAAGSGTTFGPTVDSWGFGVDTCAGCSPAPVYDTPTEEEVSPLFQYLARVNLSTPVDYKNIPRLAKEFTKKYDNSIFGSVFGRRAEGITFNQYLQLKGFNFPNGLEKLPQYAREYEKMCPMNLTRKQLSRYELIVPFSNRCEKHYSNKDYCIGTIVYDCNQKRITYFTNESRPYIPTRVTDLRGKEVQSFGGLEEKVSEPAPANEPETGEETPAAGTLGIDDGGKIILEAQANQGHLTALLGNWWVLSPLAVLMAAAGIVVGIRRSKKTE